MTPSELEAMVRNLNTRTLKSDIQRLTDQVSGLAQKIDGPPRRRR